MDFLGSTKKGGIYGRWKNFCTARNVQQAANSGINYLSTGAGFQPSTVWKMNIQTNLMMLESS